MNRGFKYLIDMYGDSGAGSKLEEICLQLVQSIFGVVYIVQCYPGDDGIDIYVSEEEKITVYQCKYFTSRIEYSQKERIREPLKV